MQLVSFGNPREVTPPEGTFQSGEYWPPPNSGESPCFYRVSTDFEVVDSHRMPLWLELESGITPDNLTEPMWFARVALHDHAPRITSIGFASEIAGSREAKASDFQRARSAIYVFYAAFCARVGPDGEPEFRVDDPSSDRRVAEFLERRRTGRQRLKTDDYKRAAQIYRDNFRDTPTQAVAEAFGVGIRQGGNIVAECRRRGFLPPTKQGRKKA